jgi:hypothetical protein
MLLLRNHSRLTGRRADFFSILLTYDLTTMKEMSCIVQPVTVRW